MEKTRANDPRDGWYSITPADAAKFLEQQPPNRKISERKVVRLAEDITRDDFKPNGETIIFDEMGRLMDGQSRCRACVIAGKPFETYVVWGVPRRYFPAIDIGEKRTSAQVVGMAGFKHGAIVASVARWSIVLANGSGSDYNSRARATNPIIMQYLRKHGKDITAAVEELWEISGEWTRSVRGVIPPSMLAYAHFHALNLDHERSLAFCTGVITGENLKPGDPALMLRRRMISSDNRHQYVQMAVLIKAMNAALENKKLGVLRWDASREVFPVLGEW